MSIKKVVSLFGALALALPSLAQAPASASASASAASPTPANPFISGPPIRIGLIFPLTGGSSDMGDSGRVGAEVAVREINAVGGYLGRPLELVIRDDKSDPELGLRHAQELVLKEKVAATIGFCNTGVAMKALDVFQNNQHVLIVPCSTGTAITAKYPAAQSYIFRNSAPSRLQTEFLVNEVVRRGLGKVALIVDSQPYGELGLKDLQTALGKVGLKPHAIERFDVGVKNLEEPMRRLKASGADVLIGWSLGPEHGVISAAREAIGWKVPQFGTWDLSHASALTASGGAVEGAMMVQTVLPNAYSERNSTFLRGYQKIKKEQPLGSMMSAAQTYDAVHLLTRAIFDAKGQLTGPALKKALENPSNILRGVVTTYEQPFSDKDHDAMTLNMLWLGVWRNHERAFYYKEDEKRATAFRRKQQ